MTLALRGEASLAGDDPGERYVLVRVGGGWYAVPVVDVREIVKLPPVTEVPGAGEGVCGVVLVHGSVVTLLDPCVVLGESPCEDDPRARLLAVDHAGERLGLRVDEVARILQIPHAQVEPAHEIAVAPGLHVAGVARSVAPTADGFAAILDVRALVHAILSERPHFS